MEPQTPQKKESPPQSPPAKNEDDGGSWVDVESLASVDSVEAVELELPPAREEYDDSVSSDSESMELADLFLSQNRVTLQPRPVKDADAPSMANDKGPRWWRLMKRMCEAVVSKVVFIARHARPSYIVKLMKPTVTTEQKLKSMVRWFMSSDWWNVIKHGGLVLTLVACLGVFLQSKVFHKGIGRKEHDIGHLSDVRADTTGHLIRADECSLLSFVRGALF